MNWGGRSLFKVGACKLQEDFDCGGPQDFHWLITPTSEASITVDNVEVAQFIYLLLKNQTIRSVIETITSKVVLVLGRFTIERKAVLDA